MSIPSRLGLFLTVPFLAACELPTTIEAGKSTATVESAVSTGTGTGVDAGNSVCNPLGGGTSLGGSHGLRADLYYLDPNGPHFDAVADYVGRGTKLDAELFFDQVNVPTRPFDAGFVTRQGSVITTPRGDTLYEWFAIEFRAMLRLAAGDAPGYKQFALIADDGAVLEQEADGRWRTVVDNDGTHAARFVAGRAPVHLDGQTSLKLRLRYYQGPRYHIAVILLWRPWNGSWRDPADGLTGISTFFDSTQTPPAARPAYDAILARGWTPVPAANYFLDDGAPANPCPVDTSTSTGTGTATETSASTDTATLRIVGFDGVTSAGDASLIWQTPGVPADGRVYWGPSAAQLDRVVDENAGPATVHQVRVTGLSGATQYFFRAESTDAAGHTVRSEVIHKVTK